MDNNEIDVETIIENNVCRKCSSSKLVKNGQSKGIKRFKCKECGTTQSNTANTPLYRLKLKNKWVDFAYLMLSEPTPLTLGQISERLDINIKTAHSWRHKFLASLNGVRPIRKVNKIEMDEVFLGFRVKGRVGKEKFDYYDYDNPKSNIPNQLRVDELNKTGYNSIWMCVHNRMGDFDFIPLKVQKKGHVRFEVIQEQMKGFDLKNLTVITDANRSLGKFLSERGDVKHLIFKSKDIKQGILVDKDLHNNNINSVMSMFHTWVETFNGYSTKYEWNYLKWFRFWRLFQKRSLDIKNAVKLTVEDRGSFDRYSNILNHYGDFITV